jgi:hypothetical protein
MLDTRERLAGHLYGSALDLDPDAAIALRIGHPDGLTWHCEDGYLTVVVGGESLPPFALNGTLQQLVSQLAVSGIEVKYANQELLHLASGALLEGAGNDQSSLADQLKVFQSNLWTVLDAYGVAVDETDRHIVEGIAQLYIGSAEGEFLDYWGEFFDVPRNADEPDPDYRTRMIVEVLRPKSNKIAIENAVSEIVGDRVELYEPWRDLFYLSVSKLDNERTFDGAAWSPYLFRPVYRGQHNIDWSKILPVIEKLRPSGVMMLDPEWVPSTRGVGVTDHSMGYARSDSQINTALYNDRMLLDHYVLGDPITHNYGVLKYDLYSQMNQGGVLGPLLGMSPRRRFVRAQVVLSDMDEGLEDARARFTGVFTTYLNTPVLGEFALSEFDPGAVTIAPEDVETPEYITGGAGNYTPFMQQGLLHFYLLNTHLRAYDQRKPKIVASTVVTAKFLEVKPTEHVVSSGWASRGWDSADWSVQYPTSGICINVKTENL